MTKANAVSGTNDTILLGGGQFAGADETFPIVLAKGVTLRGAATLKAQTSVIQHTAGGSCLEVPDSAQLERLSLSTCAIKKSGAGKLVIADVIPPDVSPLTDASQLLAFGWRGGFLTAALAGLVRTAFSDYRKLRAQYGLSTYAEADIIGLIREARKLLRFTPILALTTESQQAKRDDAKRNGATGWLVKPVGGAELVKVIKQVLPGA